MRGLSHPGHGQPRPEGAVGLRRAAGQQAVDVDPFVVALNRLHEGIHADVVGLAQIAAAGETMVKKEQSMKFAFCSLIVVSALFQGSCGSALYRSKRAEGEKIIEKITVFESKEGRLPKSLSEIGLRESEEGPVYYRQLSESRYELWYGTSLGESVTYDSERRTWQ